jgi:hypothetical protein
MMMMIMMMMAVAPRVVLPCSLLTNRDVLVDNHFVAVGKVSSQIHAAIVVVVAMLDNVASAALRIAAVVALETHVVSVVALGELVADVGKFSAAIAPLPQPVWKSHLRTQMGNSRKVSF